jgi:dihydropteroate synthase
MLKSDKKADCWQLRSTRLHVGNRPLLMGIVNVTPDSFSDGGRFFREADAVEQGLRLAADGADILDIGGESTRPGAEPVDAEEELRRVLPVVTGLRKQTALPISIDTAKAVVAKAALDAGAEAINDVTALTRDAEMLPLAVRTGCGVCAMHAQGTPRTMQQSPAYMDVVGEVLDYLRGRRDALMAVGIKQSKIALDPGIGFGKNLEHNLALLKNAGRFLELGCPVLVGHSRKRFIGQLLGDMSADRAAGTIGAALALAGQGVQILRVHDVAAVREALTLFAAAGGI